MNFWRWLPHAAFRCVRCKAVLHEGDHFHFQPDGGPPVHDDCEAR